MKWFWQSPDWQPADMNRRSFLVGAGASIASALAAPYVIRSGILMPVKKLLVPKVVSWFEASHDGVQWTRLVRAYGRSPIFQAAHFPTDGAPYKFFRTIVETEYAPQSSLNNRLGGERLYVELTVAPDQWQLTREKQKLRYKQWPRKERNDPGLLEIAARTNALAKETINAA